LLGNCGRIRNDETRIMMAIVKNTKFDGISIQIRVAAQQLASKVAVIAHYTITFSAKGANQ
jgi:hypothetical protein